MHLTTGYLCFVSLGHRRLGILTYFLTQERKNNQRTKRREKHITAEALGMTRGNTLHNWGKWAWACFYFSVPLNEPFTEEKQKCRSHDAPSEGRSAVSLARGNPSDASHETGDESIERRCRWETEEARGGTLATRERRKSH